MTVGAFDILQTFCPMSESRIASTSYEHWILDEQLT